MTRALVDAKQFHVKDKCCIWRNYSSGATFPVTKLRRDGQGSLPADPHSLYTLVPPTNNLTLTQNKLEWVVAIFARVKLSSFCALLPKPTRVMNADLLASLCFSTFTHCRVLILQTAVSCDHQNSSILNQIYRANGAFRSLKSHGCGGDGCQR